MTVRQAVRMLICLAAGTAGPATAQVWLPAACDIKPGHVLVNQGTLYLKSAATTKFADQRAKDLKDAERVLTQAVTGGGQEKNPAAWYYLGRYYLLANDLAGADSALTKAAALAPNCKDDIGLYRRQAWVPLFNGGVQAWQAGKLDSAIVSFRSANVIYQAEPMGFVYLADLLVGREAPDSTLRRTNETKYRTDSLLFATRVDSAVKYFRLAVPAASDPKYAKERRDAFFNVARAYHSVQRYDEAKGAYREYLAAYPTDLQALAGLALIYTRAGKRDSATVLYAAMLEHADSAEAGDLFSAAQVVLSTIPDAPDTAKLAEHCRAAAKRKSPALTARQLGLRCAPAAADTMRNFHATVDPAYRMAVKAYDAGLAKDPFDRDGLYNLAGISFLLGDSARVLPLVQRLFAVEPMNRSTLAKVAGAWQLIGKKDSVQRYLQLAETLPVDVTVSSFRASDNGAQLDALARNFHAKPSTPITITFEFVSPKGDVVASQPHEVPVLDKEASHEFQLKVNGTGIVAWRYKRP